jgi:hypothetical protein
MEAFVGGVFERMIGTYMTACAKPLFFYSCLNFSLLNTCVSVSLTTSHYFHLSHATNLHDDLFYSIMRVWHSDRVSHLAFLV